jgi:phosphate transport system ATP-binding protein
MPPPIRKIVVDREPTVVAPPPPQQPVDALIDGLLGGTAGTAPAVDAVERMRCERVTIAYGSKVAVNAVDLPVRQGEVLSLIGPSGCGKTTLLRALTELTPTAARGGRILLDGQDVDELEVTQLRRRVSMVFQQPNPFPMSVFDNIAYALREGASRRPGRSELTPKVEEALRRAGLWNEVKDDLGHPALRLSGGQQQRLCIARALAASPEVLLMDEPCSALDPLSTSTIEELIVELKQSVAIVIVTHNLQQARRVGDHCAFMYLGELVEYAPVEQLFEHPQAQRTKDYVRGAFG